MSVLRNLEDKIAGLVEGTFGRVFKAEVRPVELANRLAREMDLHRTESLSRTYAPHRYVVWLSPEDRDRYRPVEPEVADELAAHLLEHARAERLVLTRPPQITFQTDEALALGEFGIQVVASGEEPAPQPVAAVQARGAGREMGHTMVYSTAERHREALAGTGAAPVLRAALLAEGRRMVVPETGATIGRSRDCEIVLADENVSRHHARITQTGGSGWTIRDLGSTNGLRVNGRPVGAGDEPLRPGDAIEIGTVAARFEAG